MHRPQQGDKLSTTGGDFPGGLEVAGGECATDFSMIVIHSYGKVASSSVREAVAAIFPKECVYSHGMQPWIYELLTRYIEAAGSVGIGARPIIEAGRGIRDAMERVIAEGRQVAMITGVRDPIARSLAVAMQSMDWLFAGSVAADSEETAARMSARIRELWLEDRVTDDPVRQVAEYTIRAPLFWLREELERPFGFDLLAKPFNLGPGFQLLARNGIRLLLYRQEDAPAGVEAGLARLFPDSGIKLSRINDGSQKESAEIYERLKAGFRLPRERLVEIYGNPYVRHFYDEREIDAAIARWEEPRSPPRSQPSARTPPRATVVVPLLNNQAYIGDLLRSLLAQWRPDLELLVIDDGSSDGSFDSARDVVAAHPNVSATLLRNGAPAGLAGVPLFLRHAAGQVLIQADSDDIALPGRLDAIMACFDADPACRFVTSNAVLLSPEGIPVGLYDSTCPSEVIREPLRPAGSVGSSQWLGATSACHRSVLQDFPAIDAELCPYGLDLFVAFRATLIGTHHYLAEPLVGWRQHGRNTHRLAGADSADDEAFERHGAFELMALAQKIRDLDFVRSKSPDSNLLEPVGTACRNVFLEHFAKWSRARNRLARRQPGAAGRKAEPSITPIPPLITLRRGERRLFGRAETLGTVAQSWSGVHAPEQHWNWTARSALIVFSVAPSGAETITLGLRAGLFPGTQPVRISVNLGCFEQFEIGTTETVVSVPIGERRAHDFLTLLFHVPGAAKPSEVRPSADSRLLGVRLIWIEVS